MFRVGEEVELVQGRSGGSLFGPVAGGTRGVVLREPGLWSPSYLVRLDPAGRHVEVPADALRRSVGPWWAVPAPAFDGQAPSLLPSRPAPRPKRTPKPPASRRAQVEPAPRPASSAWHGDRVALRPARTARPEAAVDDELAPVPSPRAFPDPAEELRSRLMRRRRGRGGVAPGPDVHGTAAGDWPSTRSAGPERKGE